MSKTRQIDFTNNTDEPIDVQFLLKAPAFESLWQDYEGKQVGDDDPGTGCFLCNLAPGETDFFEQIFSDRDRLKIIARNPADGKIIYLESVTGKDLKDRDWQVMIFK